MIRGPISYTTASGLSIAYQVIGEGDRKLVWVPGSISHLELNWEFPAMARFLRRLASIGQVLMFDKRGQGLSDRDLVTLGVCEQLHVGHLDVCSTADLVRTSYCA